jgi:hypothetical protein
MVAMVGLDRFDGVNKSLGYVREIGCFRRRRSG